MKTTKRHASRLGFTQELRRRISIWFIQHAQALVFSLGQYLRNPLSNLLTAAVIGISLALPAGFYLLLENVLRISSHWDGTAQITLFLKQEIPDEDTKKLADDLEKDQRISEVIIISRANALNEYRHLSGFSEALDAVEENPFPNVLGIRLDSVLDLAQQEEVYNELAGLRQTDFLQYDRQWVQRLFTLVDIIKRAILILFALLAIAVLLIVGNTIRLSIYNRKQEIEITKLFGGSNAFIRRPFLYSGLWYGVFGAIIAWLLIRTSLQLLKAPVDRLAALYNSQFELAPPSLFYFMILLGISVILGLGGSWLSVHRHISSMESV